MVLVSRFKSQVELSLLKRLFSWFVMLIIGLLVVVFSISNHSIVTLDFWPLPILQNTPIYIPILIAGIFGFIYGGITTWLSASTSRSKARKTRRRATGLEKDLTILQNKIDKLEKKRKFIKPE